MIQYKKMILTHLFLQQLHSDCKSDARCSEVNSKGYSELEKPIYEWALNTLSTVLVHTILHLSEQLLIIHFCHDEYKVNTRQPGSDGNTPQAADFIAPQLRSATPSPKNGKSFYKNQKPQFSAKKFCVVVLNIMDYIWILLSAVSFNYDNHFFYARIIKMEVCHISGG